MTAPAELVEAMARAICLSLDACEPEWSPPEEPETLLWTRYQGDARELLQALSQAGWVVVPRVATPAMQRAFRDARPESAVETEEGGWSANSQDCWNASYAAMLSAGEG